WAQIDVRDSGSGIAPEIRARIFDPYFSTKRGAGMGLGLFIARRLVQSWGGQITVETELGRGSQFRAERPPPPPIEAKARPPDRGGCGRWRAPAGFTPSRN